MPNLITRLTLFLSSYAPLFVIIAMRGWHDSRRVAIGLIIVAAFSVVILFFFLRTVQSLAPGKVKIASVKSRDGDSMSYIVTYLLPFLAVKLNDPIDAVSLGILLSVVGILYVNSNMIHTNPVLNIAGYHIFEVEDSNGKTTALICKRSYVRTDSELSVISVGDYVLLEKK
jgi:hypothetical protein